MSTTTDVAIIGAGPYGLSLAAHLAAANVSVRVFGPADAVLAHQHARRHGAEIRRFRLELMASGRRPDTAGLLRRPGPAIQRSGLPIPVETFCAYGEAFRKRFVRMLDERPEQNSIATPTATCFVYRMAQR
jgi:2-polyprenyl-6-methoxyphenol hydroxylase-like FAD-dependent oxidoreductase